MIQREDAPYDAIVVGAGPAGSATAGLLASDGHRVLVLEKEHFPRFHIGESLLPAGMQVLDRLGVERRTDTFVYKRGATFVCEASGRSESFAFEEALPGVPEHAWHVDRASFDTMLRDRAVALGADVRHGETVTDLRAAADRVTVETRSGTHVGRYLIDASGQSRLLARRAGTSEPYDQFGATAVFTHYENLHNAAWESLGPDMDIRIVMRPEGWGWIIPLPGQRLSVGMVSKQKITPADLDTGLLEQSPLTRQLIAGATRKETRVIGNFSYRNTESCGTRFAAVGDAACFLDPVFSSGVTLALRGAEALADRVSPALKDGTEADPDLLSDHAAEMDRAYKTFSGLIDRFYNTRFAQSVFLDDSAGQSKMREGVMSVLAGDVWRSGNPFQDLLLKARRRESSES